MAYSWSSYVLDWTTLVSLAILDATLYLEVHPFEQFIAKTMLDGLMYPVKESTVPFWVVPIIAVGIPTLVFFANSIRMRKFQESYHAILGLLYAVLLTGVLTDALKNAIGRPRPDFFWRCFPDGNGIFSQTTGEVLCNGDLSVIREGRKSFPSGHSSWCFAGFGFLSIYLSHKLQLFDGKGHAARLLIVLTPLVFATAIAITRLDDYMHHWQDVFIGALLGLGMATLSYSQFFPRPESYMNERGCFFGGQFLFYHTKAISLLIILALVVLSIGYFKL